MAIDAWQPIPFTRGRYEASKDGRIRATFCFGTGRPRGQSGGLDGEVLKHSPGTRGYPTVMLSLEGEKRSKPYSVASLVLMAFIGPKPSPKHRACYLDGDRNNVTLHNLLWMDPHGSRLLAIKNGRAGGWAGRKQRIDAICAKRLEEFRRHQQDQTATLFAEGK